MSNRDFNNRTIYETSFYPNRLKLIDINNDKICDLIVSHHPESLSIIINNGNGSFIHQITYSTERSVHTILTIDIIFGKSYVQFHAVRKYSTIFFSINSLHTLISLYDTFSFVIMKFQVRLIMIESSIIESHTKVFIRENIRSDEGNLAESSQIVFSLVRST
jgi:hypothetical protein